jgi:hypothetical protein
VFDTIQHRVCIYLGHTETPDTATAIPTSNPSDPLPHRQGGYTFYYTNPHVFTCKTIPCSEDPISTIVAILDYHTSEVGWHLSIQPNTFNQIMVQGYPNLTKPPHCIWEYREEEEEQKEKEQEVKFNWFSSSEDNIREEVTRILKVRESGSG